MTSSTATSAPFGRVGRNTGGTMRDVFLASIPAALVGSWELGRALLSVHAAAAPDAATAIEAAVWQIGFLDSLGLPSTSTILPGLLGLTLLAPALLVALIVSRGWAELFAHFRGRPLDPSWALAAWLFVLLLPAGVPAYFVALGMSFGAVIGCHIFGGSGRYLVNPSLLGVIFLVVAYPGLLAAGVWVPGTELLPTWESVVSAGMDANGQSWSRALLGQQIGATGAASAGACALGAAYLIVRRRAAWQSLVGAVAGLSLAGWWLATLPWYWHLVLGNFAFASAFILTDPTTAARRRAGCWAQAMSFGVLTVLIRTLNPDHPEGTLFALLLAALFTPLFDHLSSRCRIALRRRRHAR
jgi:Na+-transporting NADH:ubiquinone oxidoreductase subunit B